MSQYAVKSEVEAWIAEAREGVEEALGHLFGHYRDYLLLVANRQIRSGIRPKAAASDVVQDTFMDAQLAFAGFRGGTELEIRRWLHRILLNNIRETRRQFTVVSKRDIDREQSLAAGHASLGAQLASLDESPASVVASNEQFAALQEVLESLTHDQRTVVVMRSFEQRPYAEIAAQMNRSPNAVRMLWARTIERIRNELGLADE